jgi:hypothetical protein
MIGFRENFSELIGAHRNFAEVAGVSGVLLK